jgi:hypothetical protein
LFEVWREQIFLYALKASYTTTQIQDIRVSPRWCIFLSAFINSRLVNAPLSVVHHMLSEVSITW